MNKQNKTIIITGTHHTPAHELIHQLQHDSKTNWHIYYISHQYPTETHLANSIIPQIGKGNFFSIDCGKFYRQSYFKTILGLHRIVLAFFKSVLLIHHIKPNIVVSFGGYVSVPVVMASYLHHIPSITHEQTTTMSLSTKINSIFSTRVALSFDPPHLHRKHILTGNLLRSAIFQTNNTKFNKTIIPFIYVTGGNQGSLFINQIIYQLLPKLCQRFTIIHQTGNKPTKQFSSHKYIQQNYIDTDDIGFILQQSQLLISRSGANICQEIVTFKKKSILIPLPLSQQNEQLLNAQWVQRQLPQQTIILDQSKTTPKDIIIAINKLSQIPTNPQTKPTITNLKLLNLIHELVKT